MPIYEYRCAACQAELSIRFSSVAQAEAQGASCTQCGSAELTRLISRVAVARGRGQPTPGAAAGGAGGEQPQALAQAMQAAASGRDMGRDFGEVAARLGQGESARSVETSLRKRVGEQMEPH